MRIAVLAGAIAVAARAAEGQDDARAIVRQATVAVEAGEAEALRARWEERLLRAPGDRAAVLGLATLARLGYEYERADELYTAILMGARDRHASYARLGRAWALEDRGFSNQSGAEFERARSLARALGDPVAEAEALVGLAFPRGRVEGVFVALAILEAAEPLVPPSVPELEAELLRRRAALLGTLGRADAMASAQAAVATARRSGLVRVHAQAVRMVARVLCWRGDTEAALATLREAEALFDRARDRAWLGVAIIDRVEALLESGQPAEAHVAAERALAEGEASRNGWTVGTAHAQMGSAAVLMGDLAVGAGHLRRAVEMFEAQGDPSSTMGPRAWLAVVAMATGDLEEARRATLEVLAFYRRMDEANFQFDGHRALAAIAMRQGDWAAAERALADARELTRRRRLPRWRARLAHDEGRLALLRGDLAAAERSFTAYLRSLGAHQQVARFDARLRLADVHAQRGDPARAEEDARSAWDELDRWRATLTDRELRVLAFQASPSQFQAALLERGEQRASVARVLAALVSSGRTEAAFELAERRRARELIDRIVRAEALRVGGDGHEHGAAPAGAGPTTAAAVAAAIPDGQTAILEYVAGGDGAPITVFVVQRSGVEGLVLPPAPGLRADVERLVTMLESGAAADAPVATLGAALLAPVLAALGPEVSRLIVVPDGPLHRVPFDVLRLPDGHPAVERFAIGAAPSAAVLAALWRRGHGRSDPRPVRLLAFGDPAFATAAAAPAPPGAPEETSERVRALPRLDASAGEARLVARYADAEVRLREAATADALRGGALERYRVLHLATHAIVDERVAARTALALAPGAAPGDSGLVRVKDLAALRLDADLVVLSACHTAGGVLVDGEGVQGLTAPLLQAGARSVVATAWRIGDRSTVGLVRSLYEGLAAGLPVGDALREAKLAALRRGAPASEWAAFAVIGDPLVVVPLRAAPSVLERWWLLALAIAGLAAAAAAAQVHRARARRRAPEPTSDAPDTSASRGARGLVRYSLAPGQSAKRWKSKTSR